MFDIEYYNRYNQRIYVNSDLVGGSPATGAISDIVVANLAPDLALVSSPSGKVVVSSTPASKLNNLSDTTGPIGAALDGKEPVFSKGNVSEVTSSVLTISGGTGAVIGAGVQIQVKQATVAQSGYLSAADWATFNSKLSPSLDSAKILVGDGGGTAQQRLLSGDVTMTNLGVVTISNDAVTSAKIAAGVAVNKLASMSADRAVVTDGSGFISASSVTSTELGYLSGASSSIQTQLNNRLQATISGLAQGDLLYYNGTAWVNLARGSTGQVLTATAGSIQWQAGVANGIPTGGASGAFLKKNSASDYDVSWATLSISDISGITASASQINALTAGFYDATSSVQNQINNKLDKSLTYNNIFVGNISGVASPLATSGTDGHVLMASGGAPVWQSISQLSGAIGINVAATHTLHVRAPSANSSILLIEEDSGSNALEITEVSGAIKIGIFGATPVVQQAGLTAITHTAPGTPDYAIQDLTNSGGYGFVTKDEGNTVLSVIKAMHDAMKAYGLLT